MSFMDRKIIKTQSPRLTGRIHLKKMSVETLIKETAQLGKIDLQSLLERCPVK